MPSMRPASLPSHAGRIAHDLGLAGLLGGQLFGRMAFHPAVAGISDKAERGKVVNAAWRRYGTVNTLSLLAVGAGWASARATHLQGRRITERERRLAQAKDVLVGAVAVTGLATAAEGVRFARSAPDGAVPMEDGDTAAAEATGSSRRTKRALTVLGTANVAAEIGLVAVNAALSQESYGRPSAWRSVRRST